MHVVTIGLNTTEHAPRDRRLFAYEDLNGEPLESRHAVITPYLFDGGALANPHLVVREEGRTINGLIQLVTGSQPIDDGLYIFNAEERLAFLDAEPDAATLLRPFAALVSTYKVASAGFLRCMTLRPLLWRNCHESENASPPFALTEGPANERPH